MRVAAAVLQPGSLLVRYLAELREPGPPCWAPLGGCEGVLASSKGTAGSVCCRGSSSQLHLAVQLRRFSTSHLNFLSALLLLVHLCWWRSLSGKVLRVASSIVYGRAALQITPAKLQVPPQHASSSHVNLLNSKSQDQLVFI